jgi:hypothetical protein
VTTPFARLLVVSLVVMGISHTIAKERLFEPLRTRLGGKDTWFGYLVSCPYCLSHSIAFLLVPLTGAYAVEIAPHWGVVSEVLRWFLSSILVAIVAAFFRVIFYFIDETQGLVRREQRSVEEEIELRERALRSVGQERGQERSQERGQARASGQDRSSSAARSAAPKR